MTSSRPVKAATAALGALAAAVTLTAVPAPAEARALSISCAASGQSRFSPGVQLLPQSQQVTYLGDERSCNDHSGNGITGARITADFRDVRLSCVASQYVSGSGTGTITWDNGETSSVEVSIDESLFHQASVSGVVRRGLFAGKRFTGQFSTDLLAGGVKCTAGVFFGGLRQAPFTGEFSIG
ncbi:hypothetical protein HNP84_008714 [Thermocatellispora tengchongensis]|uniref:Uncharacterized protein n=1 Tax=Thermocatellispora tengchongensis TaxID=1073253 RepID=A0A840PIJ3_9ACTN|nr:hypothetical protein [Thermocatellispora tengchongensis]MBB5138952.1 hypothetical protein [Thermocatellispora tengchongensis]